MPEVAGADRPRADEPRADRPRADDPRADPPRSDQSRADGQSATHRPAGPHVPPLRAARRLLHAKHRAAAGRLLAEGPQAVRAAIDAGVAEHIFIAESQADRSSSLAEAAWGAGAAVHLVSDEAVADLTTAQTPQGVVAMCRWRPQPLRDWLLRSAAVESSTGSPPDEPGQGGAAPEPPGSAPDPTADPAPDAGASPLILLAHEIADPGNAGAIIRVADAAGAHAVAFSERSVDPSNAKAVRASAGSLFGIPVLAAGPTLEAIAALQATGLRVIAADVTPRSTGLFSAERQGLLDGAVAWVFGNEAHGLPQEILGAADEVVRIPILGSAESLNLATAAAVCLYAVARVRAYPGEPNPVTD